MKLLFNSIKFFYLNIPLEQPEYMCMCFDIMPEKIVDKHHLHQLPDSDEWVYTEIMKGVYGLS